MGGPDVRYASTPGTSSTGQAATAAAAATARGTTIGAVAVVVAVAGRRICPLEIDFEKTTFRTLKDITGQKVQELVLNLKSFLTLRTCS